MKKFYFLTTVILFSLAILKANAQENLILGGSMEAEDEGFWLVSNLSNDPTSTTEYSFGYKDDKPEAGKDGCLHFSEVNIGTNGSHIMFYQEVTLQKGKTYEFDLAAKAIQEMNNSWFEVYIGPEPEEGSDYGTSNGSLPLGGFKWSGWEGGCAGLDLFDGTLREIGCMAHSQDTIWFEGEGDTTLYIGFKAGIWAFDWTVEFVVDNVSLIEKGTTSVESMMSEKTTLYPNPVRNTLEIVSGTMFSQAKILNISGKEVIKTRSFTNSIDVSSLTPGVYFVELKDFKDNTIVKRFSKQ